jgi:formylglycine-generating enzyme required for sulfatase activity
MASHGLSMVLAGAALLTACDPARPKVEVYVPAGSFSMGCSPDDGACDAAESPYHDVAMSAFYIDRTEVTQAAYGACIAHRAEGLGVGVRLRVPLRGRRAVVQARAPNGPPVRATGPLLSNIK